MWERAIIAAMALRLKIVGENAAAAGKHPRMTFGVNGGRRSPEVAPVVTTLVPAGQPTKPLTLV